MEDFQELLDTLGITLGEGSGDYTQDRHQWLDKVALEELFLVMQQAETDASQYDEIW